MSPHPKRTKVFMLNGQLYEGGIEEAFRARNNLGAVGSPNGVLPPAEGKAEEDKK
jgi:hypothetical protein